MKCYRFLLDEFGLPIIEPIIYAESQSENEFWVEFISMAWTEREIARVKEKTFPISASIKLRAMYKKAIIKFNGRGTCQICQLKKIFIF